MITEGGPALVVEIVQQRDDTPSLFVLAELPGVPADGRFHGQRVLQETVALGVFGQQGPGVLAGQRHGLRHKIPMM